MIFFTTFITDLGHQTGILGGNEMVKQTCAWHWCKVISNNSICSSPCCHQHSIAKFACGWHVSVAVEFDDRCVTRITQVSHMPQYKAMWPFKAQSCGYETLLNLAIKFPLGFQDGPIVRFSHGKLSGEITRDTELVTSLLTCLLKDYNMCTDIEKETFIEIYTCNVYIYIIQSYKLELHNHVWNIYWRNFSTLYLCTCFTNMRIAYFNKYCNSLRNKPPFPSQEIHLNSFLMQMSHVVTLGLGSIFSDFSHVFLINRVRAVVVKSYGKLKS